MNEKNSIQKRQTARWTNVNDLLSGSFIKNEDGSFSYRTKSGFVVTRVNVFGVVLSKDSNDFFDGIVIDDGTGNIGVKSFDKKGIFENIEVGDIVNVVGKIREYNQTPFISVEFVKKSNNRAFTLRKKELPVVQKFYDIEKEQIQNVEEVVVSNDKDRILELLKELDEGDGVDIEILSEKSSMKNINEVVKELIRNGDVFEVMPGRLKVLE